MAPVQAALLYMFLWGFFTALLRPLAGERGWEFLERSYNFGIPVLMLWVHGFGTNTTSWFVVIGDVPRFIVARAQISQWALCSIMASMFIGHGVLGWC
jgi:hypothetical protein